jgi:hypothetical protein
LWEYSPEGMDEWLELQYASSISSTIFHAITHLVSDVNVEDLKLDLETDKSRFWITESTGGGIGLVAKIVESIAQHPHRLELRLMDSIRHCSREQFSFQLGAIINLIDNQNEELASQFQNIRGEKDFISLTKAKSSLIKVLETHAIPVNRELIVAINAKFLRPNSDKYTDNLIVDLLKKWSSEENRLGHEIDLRTFAVAVGFDALIKEQLNDILKKIGNFEVIQENQRFNLLQSMLWTDCHDSCEECIEYKSRYQTTIHPSRHLLLAILESEELRIDYSQEDWRMTIMKTLSEKYQATLHCSYNKIEQCKSDILELLFDPIEVTFQQFFPSIETIERQADGWLIKLILREMIG